MKGAQKQGYEAWLSPTLRSTLELAYTWCRSSASEDSSAGGAAVLMAAIADLDVHAITHTVRAICDGLDASPPNPEIVALAQFEQPDAQMQTAHSIALSSDHVKTGLIALKMNISKLKQQIVTIHMTAFAKASEAAALESYMGCMPLCDAFKNMCDDMERALGNDMPQDFTALCQSEILMAQKHIRATVGKTYLDSLNLSISKRLLPGLPPDYQDIVRSQIRTSIRTCMFTKKAMKQIEATDEIELAYKAFKGSKVLSMGSFDDAFVAKWSMIQAQMHKCI